MDDVAAVRDSNLGIAGVANVDIIATSCVGQLEASPQPMTGGSFSISGGFWSLVAIPTAPTFTGSPLN